MSYNPLDIENLGKSVLTAMLGKDPVRLGDVGVFPGAGVYVLYYLGPFESYKLLSKANADGFVVPIYVGKAIPAGGRKGVAVSRTTYQLSARLRQHARSIDEAKNLDLSDFWARYLVVDPIWIPLGESLLISHDAPVWNTIVDGFGNHDPGKGRIRGVMSAWDTLHPGRKWASKYPPRSQSAEKIALDAAEYLRQRLGP